MERLSVTILTKNEERRIRDCLESVKWADEIIIVDDESSDRTLEICRAYTDRIFIIKMSDGFSKQRAYSFQQAGGDWILIPDADQTVSEGLKEEIQGILKTAVTATASLFPGQPVILENGLDIAAGGRRLWSCSVRIRL